MGPRMRCNREDYNVLEYYIADLKALERPVTFRVSGMVIGPEEFVERIAPEQGHIVEVFGPDGETAVGRVRRLNKNDDLERDASCLIGAHALWLWVTDSELYRRSTHVDPEMVQIAHELGVPVLVFLPASNEFEIVEMERT